jgi:hypothetical protein
MNTLRDAARQQALLLFGRRKDLIDMTGGSETRPVAALKFAPGPAQCWEACSISRARPVGVQAHGDVPIISSPEPYAPGGTRYPRPPGRAMVVPTNRDWQ